MLAMFQLQQKMTFSLTEFLWRCTYASALFFLIYLVVDDSYFGLRSPFIWPIFALYYLLLLPLFLLSILSKPKSTFTSIVIRCSAIGLLFTALLLVLQNARGAGCTGVGAISDLCFTERTYIVGTMSSYPWAFAFLAIVLLGLIGAAFVSETTARSRMPALRQKE